MKSPSSEEKRKVTTFLGEAQEEENDNKEARNDRSGTTKKTTQLSLEEQSSEPRVKFQTEFVKDVSPPLDEEWQPLARALATSEALGAAPVCPREGFVFGNGAVLSKSRCKTTMSLSIVVSKSGRCAGTAFTRSQFVRVTAFDNDSWKATYGGVEHEEGNTNQSSIKPSSDTPLLWNALMVAPTKCSWPLQPQFVLHGHSCASKEEADAKGYPCSTEETLFSTPADLAALMGLLERYPYPTNQVYVRKNHGFFLLAQSEDEACRIFREELAPTTSQQEAESAPNKQDKDYANA